LELALGIRLHKTIPPADLWQEVRIVPGSTQQKTYYADLRWAGINVRHTLEE